MQGPPVEWVLKMDTDALVIGAFADAVSDRFRSDRQLGMVGSYDHYCDGTVVDISRWEKSFRKVRSPVGLRRSAKRPLRFNILSPRGRERMRLIQAAERNGYRLGQHCQGGAYALSMGAVRALAAANWLGGRLWSGTLLPEDGVMSVSVCAVGWSLAGMVEPGEPFAVKHRGIPGAPRALRDAGYGVVHSVKSHGDWTEEELRAEFRALRLASR